MEDMSAMFFPISNDLLLNKAVSESVVGHPLTWILLWRHNIY